MDQQLNGPIQQSGRIQTIDVLRGFALLGILLMNIQGFSMPAMAYLNPTLFGDFSGINYSVWFAEHVFVSQKMMNIFSMLFGAGLIIMTSRLEQTGRPVNAIYLRRTFILFLFGLIHIILLWFGDILAAYAICAFVVFWFRHLPPGRLLLAGFLLFLLYATAQLWQGWQIIHFTPSELDAFVKENWIPSEENLQGEIHMFQYSWYTETHVRLIIAYYVQVVDFIFHMGILRPIGMMFAGMALYKWDIFNIEKNECMYKGFIGLAVFIGLPMTLYEIYHVTQSGWTAESFYFIGRQFSYWAAPLISLGWIGMILLACKHGWLFGLERPLAAVGQMALSNYILHSVICAALFYGHGFGLIGSLDRFQQLLIVLAVWIVQLILSPVWLYYFRFGPLEWLWRSLTYWKIQPLRRV